jgi:hypothetical protein
MINGTEFNLQVAAFPSGASAWNHYNTNITSPTLDKTVKGKTYFYIVYSNKLRIDSKLIATIIHDN